MQSRLLSSSKSLVRSGTQSLAFVFSLVFVFALTAISGCVGGPITDGAEAEPSPAPNSPTPDVEPECVATSCDADACGLVPDGCGDTLDCGRCRDADAVAALMPTVDRAIDVFMEQSYMHDILPLDVVDIRAAAEEAIASTPVAPAAGDDPALLNALGQTVRAFRNGHSAVFSNTGCAALGGADSYTTAYSVCGRPLDGAVVVTHQVGLTNPLGLQPGDTVVALNGHDGEALTRAVLTRPLCSGGTADAEGDRELAAGSLFAVLREGDVLRVQDVDGELRDINVPASTALTPAGCGLMGHDAFEPFVAGQVREDGVAVIRLSRMILFPGEAGHIDVVTEDDIDTYIDNMVALVKTEFDRVTPNATGLIWDIRGNIGGASPVGFAIAEGMIGARATALARCTTRQPGSDPISYFFGGPDYDLAPDANEPFAFDGPTALLTDGRSISAGDYFALAVSLGTDVEIYGRPSAGAYGGGGASTSIDDTRGLGLSYDPYRCNVPESGEALETRSVQPHHFVEYAAEDLAIGRDTVVETAAADLLAN